MALNHPQNLILRGDGLNVRQDYRWFGDVRSLVLRAFDNGCIEKRPFEVGSEHDIPLQYQNEHLVPLRLYFQGPEAVHSIPGLDIQNPARSCRKAWSLIESRHPGAAV